MSAIENRQLELAILGCGAVTEIFHLPAAQNSKRVKVKMLVDKDLRRAQLLARRFNVPVASDDWATIERHAAAALVALPQDLHAPISIELLKRGIPTLVEKPMALTRQECDGMIAQAHKSGCVLAVGLVRRFIPGFQFVKNSLDKGIIGDMTDFDFRDGGIYDWPLRSGFRFDKKAGGGGVLIDAGSHNVDAVLWWLGDWKSVEYYDDAKGGVEANCELHLHMRNGASGILELSRTRKLRNSCILRGSRGVLEAAELNSSVRLQVGGHEVVMEGHAVREGIGEESFLDAFSKQLDDFAGAVLHGRAPSVPGEEGRRSVELIEACYASRRPLELPWDL